MLCGRVSANGHSNQGDPNLHITPPALRLRPPLSASGKMSTIQGTSTSECALSEYSPTLYCNRCIIQCRHSSQFLRSRRFAPSSQNHTAKTIKPPRNQQTFSTTTTKQLQPKITPSGRLLTPYPSPQPPSTLPRSQYTSPQPY
jgi:hypothetical protein